MAVTTESTFQFFGGAQKSLGADRRPANGPFRSGVSLHSHTMFSPGLPAGRKANQRQFELPALISLTDHDDIRAAALCGFSTVTAKYRFQPNGPSPSAPLSFTSVCTTYPEQSIAIQAELAHFTADPVPENLAGILDRLNSVPDLLVVVNHPLWARKESARTGTSRLSTHC